MNELKSSGQGTAAEQLAGREPSPAERLHILRVARLQIRPIGGGLEHVNRESHPKVVQTHSNEDDFI